MTSAPFFRAHFLRPRFATLPAKLDSSLVLAVVVNVFLDLASGWSSTWAAMALRLRKGSPS